METCRAYALLLIHALHHAKSSHVSTDLNVFPSFIHVCQSLITPVHKAATHFMGTISFLAGIVVANVNLVMTMKWCACVSTVFLTMIRGIVHSCHGQIKKRNCACGGKKMKAWYSIIFLNIHAQISSLWFIWAPLWGTFSTMQNACCSLCPSICLCRKQLKDHRMKFQIWYWKFYKRLVSQFSFHLDQTSFNDLIIWRPACISVHV